MKGKIVTEIVKYLAQGNVDKERTVVLWVKTESQSKNIDDVQKTIEELKKIDVIEKFSEKNIGLTVYGERLRKVYEGNTDFTIEEVEDFVLKEKEKDEKEKNRIEKEKKKKPVKKQTKLQKAGVVFVNVVVLLFLILLVLAQFF